MMPSRPSSHLDQWSNILLWHQSSNVFAVEAGVSVDGLEYIGFEDESNDEDSSEETVGQHCCCQEKETCFSSLGTWAGCKN